MFRNNLNHVSLKECLAIILAEEEPCESVLELASEIMCHTCPGLSPMDEEIAFFTKLEITGDTYLKEIPHLSENNQIKILAAFELAKKYAAYRSQSIHTARIPSIYSSAKTLGIPPLAVHALEQITGKNRTEVREWIGFVPIHRTGKLGRLCIVDQGTRTHINIDPAELFSRILSMRPRGFFLFHNHPSGILIPSEQDIHLTEKVRMISEQLGLKLLGHWIVTVESEYWIQEDLS